MENIEILGVAGVAAITVICFLIGQIVKATNAPNEWIPCIVGVCGGVLGVDVVALEQDVVLRLASRGERERDGHARYDSVDFHPFKYFSASRAALHPEAAAVTAWR